MGRARQRVLIEREGGAAGRTTLTAVANMLLYEVNTERSYASQATRRTTFSRSHAVLGRASEAVRAQAVRPAHATRQRECRHFSRRFIVDSVHRLLRIIREEVASSTFFLE